MPQQVGRLLPELWRVQRTGKHPAVINERRVRVFQQFSVRFVRFNFMFWCTLGIVGAELIRRQILKASGKLCVTAARNL